MGHPSFFVGMEENDRANFQLEEVAWDMWMGCIGVCQEV